MMNRIGFVLAAICLATSAHAKVSAPEADRLGKDLTPNGAEKAGNKDGSIPAWDGGYVLPAPAKEEWRHLSAYPLTIKDKPLYTITAANMASYKGKLTVGQEAMLKRFPDTYKLPVYPSRRTASLPAFIIEATKKNALTAELGNGGESLLNAVTGTPFPITSSPLEIIWNHKVRYRGLSLRRFNTQLAVQTSGDFQPYKLEEDVRFQYTLSKTPAEIENVIIYFLQNTKSPPRVAGNVLLVHETMDQIKEQRRAWLYNPGQRRVRRAPNVAYDNPGNGSDGLRTNDQLDGFNGATDRYTWKLVGKREMIVPYNSVGLVDNTIKYTSMAKKNHLNQDLTRYELHRVWVVESQLKPGTSHLYGRRTFYVDEDTWSIVAIDIYDNRGELWRVHEEHFVNIPWLQRVAPVCGTVYDLHSGRYLLMNLSNEEPLFEDRDFPLDYYSSSNMAKVSGR
jgi:hypothetical protein